MAHLDQIHWKVHSCLPYHPHPIHLPIQEILQGELLDQLCRTYHFAHSLVPAGVSSNRLYRERILGRADYFRTFLREYDGHWMFLVKCDVCDTL